MATTLDPSGRGGDPYFAAHATSYHRFMLGLKWVAITLGSLLVSLTLWFATNTGFIGGAFCGLVVFGLGVLAMNNGLQHSTEQDNPGGPHS